MGKLFISAVFNNKSCAYLFLKGVMVSLPETGQSGKIGRPLLDWYLS
jgi:hypothetical protein